MKNVEKAASFKMPMALFEKLAEYAKAEDLTISSDLRRIIRKQLDL